MDSVQEIRMKLHVVVGELLAGGLTNGEIIQTLQQDCKLTVEEAQTTLREVYDSWTSVRQGLNLQMEDDSNWHQYLRMKLLQRAMKSETDSSQRLALQILDSLATIQGIAAVPELVVPVRIELVERSQDDDQAVASPGN